jgi:hypothetical protein
MYGNYRLESDNTYLDVAKATKIFSRQKLMTKLVAVKLTILFIKNHIDFPIDNLTLKAVLVYSKILPRNIPVV